MKKILLFISIVSLSVLSLPPLFLQNVEASGIISNGSGIANIVLEGMEREEAKIVLDEQIESWQAKEPILAENDYETVHIPRTIFRFNVEATLDELEEKTKRHWSNFFQKRKNVKIPLMVEIDSSKFDSLNWSSNIDTEATIEKAVLLASNLQDGNVVLEYQEDAAVQEIKIADVTLNLPEVSKATLIRLAEELNGSVIKSEETFSFLDKIDLPEGMANSETEMSFIASGLYMLILQTEMEVVERNQAESLPSYVEPGLEAIVDRGQGKNLLIYNPAAHAFSIKAVVDGDKLYIEISTTKKEKQFSYVIENKKEIKPRTIYRYSNELTGDEREVITDGHPGLQLEVYREALDSTGAIENSELISRDYYPPQHEVVLIAAESESVISEDVQETQEQEIEFNQIPIVDDLSLEEKITIIEGCEGNQDCETEHEISPIDKMIAACFTDIQGNEQESDVAGEIVDFSEENRFCDLIYMTLIFQLFSNGEFTQLEEQITDAEFLETEELLEDNLDIQQEETEEVE